MAEKERDNSFGIASVVMGILSIIFSIIVLPGAIFSVLGIIFAFIQRKKHKNKWWIAGLVLSLIGLAIAMIIVIKVKAMVGDFSELIATCQANPNSDPRCAQIISQMSQYGTQ